MLKNSERALALKAAHFDGMYVTASWGYVEAESAYLLTLSNGEYVMRRVYLESAEECYDYACKIEARMYRAFYDMSEDVPVDVVAGDTYSAQPALNALVEPDALVVDKPIEVAADKSAIWVGTPETCIMWHGRHVSASIYAEDSTKYAAAIDCYGSVKLVTGKDPVELRDIAFWVDRCITRYVADNKLVVLDDDYECNPPVPRSCYMVYHVDDIPRADDEPPVVDKNGYPFF